MAFLCVQLLGNSLRSVIDLVIAVDGTFAARRKYVPYLVEISPFF
jgi:hypothetical protein